MPRLWDQTRDAVSRELWFCLSVVRGTVRVHEFLAAAIYPDDRRGATRQAVGEFSGREYGVQINSLLLFPLDLDYFKLGSLRNFQVPDTCAFGSFRLVRTRTA
jgi:hypothetical protein